MNPHAYKSNTAAQSNAHIKNSNFHSDNRQRLYADLQQERISKRKIIPRKENNPLHAADFVLRFFSGTVVTDYIPGIEWGAYCYDVINTNNLSR